VQILDTLFGDGERQSKQKTCQSIFVSLNVNPHIELKTVAGQAGRTQRLRWQVGIWKALLSRSCTTAK
jgi:hypothetical protein